MSRLISWLENQTTVKDVQCEYFTYHRIANKFVIKKGINSLRDGANRDLASKLYFLTLSSVDRSTLLALQLASSLSSAYVLGGLYCKQNGPSEFIVFAPMIKLVCNAFVYMQQM